MPDQDLIDRICRFADSQGIGDAAFPTEIEGFTVVRGRARTDLEPTIPGPFLCLVLQGSKEAYLGDQHVVYSAGQSLIVSLDVPSISRVTEASVARPYVALTLAIDIGLIRDLSAELCNDESVRCESCAMASGEADAALTAAMGRLFDLLGRPLEQRVLLPLLLREIHFRIMLAGHGGLLRRLVQRDSHASRIARCLARIRSDFAKPLSVAELAEMAGMSLSSFHEHFKAVTATTPLQYQKDLRLLEARRRLSIEAASISTVAFEVGYESPTQFSREYSRKFGVPPRDDRRHAGAALIETSAA